MVWLLRQRMGGLAGYGVWATLFKATSAAAGHWRGSLWCGEIRWAATNLPLSGFLQELAVVGLAGAVGVTVYLVLAFCRFARGKGMLLQRIKR